MRTCPRKARLAAENEPWRIVVDPSTARYIRWLDRPQRERLERVLADLPAGDMRRLAGEQRLWQLRVGGWRITFERDDRGREILVLVVRPRGDAYTS